MKILTRILGVVFAGCALAHPAFSQTDRPPETSLSAAERDSLHALGEGRMQAGAFVEAVEVFNRLVEAVPEDAGARAQLGYAYLKAEQYRAAVAAFKAAKKLDRTRPEAYVGLGLAYAEDPGRGLQALYHFRRAVGEAKRAIKLNPDYAPAYRLLGDLYERFRQDHKKAIGYYVKYLELETEDPEGIYHFGLACVQAGQYDRIDRHIVPYLKAHPEEVRLLPLTAQGYFFLERYEAALEHFERYLQHLDEGERRLYTDISLVASRKELAAYEACPDEAERQAYLEMFWKRRDPDILTGINERVIEHYRRVWYSRTFFSEHVQPWGRRGQVYIRYGEPDHRARSGQRQAQVSAEVEAVRTRMAVDIYGPEAAYLTFVGPVFPIKVHRDPYSVSTAFNAPDELSEESVAQAQQDASALDRDDATLVDQAEEGLDMVEAEEAEAPGESEYVGQREDAWRVNPRFGFEDYAPVTLGAEFQSVAWESWTYTQIQGGIEFTFTDELGNGLYDFAPAPSTPTGDRQINRVGRLTEYAPGVVFERAADATPDYYRPGAGRDPIYFYYDLATFRGTGEGTYLEVYYGVPPSEVEIRQAEGQHYIRVQAALALADEGHTEIHRNAEVFLYERPSGFDLAEGVFVPDVLALEVPPGKYELQVQLKDTNSGRVGTYKQDLEVADYGPEALRISSIELAHDIGEKPSNTRFLKGDIWVVPMPSRAYRGAQKVYAYFEVYNLKKDAFGRTRYKVQYLVRYNPRAIRGVLGSVATGLQSLLKYRKPQVSVSYEQVGSEPTTHEYVELDLQKAKRGVNVLEVRITDLVSGETTVQEVSFQYGM